MFRIDLRAVERAPVELAGTIPADDPAFAGLDFTFGAPVRLSGRVSIAGARRFYWHGRIDTTARAECRRCLAAVVVPVHHAIDVVFTEDQDAEDPSEYVIAEGSIVLDVREAVREELILAVPEYVLCGEACRGICPDCGTDLNTGTCTCAPTTDPRWAGLEALRGARPDHEG